MKNQDLNQFTIETEQEDDGRWIAEVLEIPGILVYGETEPQAIAQVQTLALRVIADKLEHPSFPCTHDAERLEMHSYAERRNDQ